MAWMYIVRCKDGAYYTGSTAKEPEARVWEHNHDHDISARFTRRRRPVVLVYVEAFDRIEDAFQREKKVQGWSRAKKAALIAGRSDLLQALSRGKNSTEQQEQADL